MKKLIISADDFGYSYYFNKMILELLEEGCVTSTSVMVDDVTKDQVEQVEQLKNLAKSLSISVGLHINFKTDEFEQEIKRQCDTFYKLFGFTPHHIDLYKPLNMRDEYKVVQEYCMEKNLPCRNVSIFDSRIMLDGVITTKESIFEGTHKTFDEICSWISKLGDGISEIVFHPGYFDPDSTSTLNKEHKREKDAEHIRMIQPILKERDIRLANYHNMVVDA